MHISILMSHFAIGARLLLLCCLFIRMAKNTGSVAFRKLDVDALNEDAYHEDEEVPETPGMGPDESEVAGQLASGRLVDALKSALKNPPLRTKHQPTKDRATQLVLRVLTSFKQTDVPKAIEALEREQLDLLMKYIYKCFEFPSGASSAQLLNWHEQVVQTAGLGCIVRVLTDRKRL